jgi:hypothetical protein
MLQQPALQGSGVDGEKLGTPRSTLQPPHRSHRALRAILVAIAAIEMDMNPAVAEPVN